MRKLILVLAVATLLSGNVRGWTAAKEKRERYPCSFTTGNGKLVSLTDAQKARAQSVKLGRPVGVIRNEVGWGEVNDVIRCVARHYGMAPAPFIAVAKCESGGNPANDSNPIYGGLFQYLPSTWAAVSAANGHKGASVLDGYAQIHSTVRHVKAHGWSAWGICI